MTQAKINNFGYTVSVVFLLCSIFYSFSSLKEIFYTNAHIASGYNAASHILLVIFFYIILHDPEYLRGRPDLFKILPVVGSSACRIVNYLLRYCRNWKQVGWLIGSVAGYEVLILVCIYFMYFGDDASQSWFLCFKPWTRYKNDVIISDEMHFNYPTYPPPEYKQTEKFKEMIIV